ncbi:MAG: Methyl sulfide methyltransferase-associated sensor [Candidatus Methanogaster sp.]|nr:MAG: Methyl sulfide methyltransferase-associated sensor [ANME-2 cluster archaeon]
MRLQFKLILLFIAISIVPFGVIGYYTYTISAESMEAHAIMHLNSVAEAKANQINSWLAEQRGVIRVIARTPSVVQDINVMTTADPSSEAYQQATEGMARFGDMVTEECNTFDEIFVLAPDGIVIASTDKAVIGDDRSSREYYRFGLNETHLTGVYESPMLHKSTMLISTPILIDDRTIGVVVGRICINMIPATIQDCRGIGKTGKAFLIDKDDNLLSSPEDGAVPPVFTYNAIGDYCGIYDRDGMTVVGAHAKVSDPGWVLIIEQNHDEILSALHTLLERAIAVTFGVIILITLFSIFVAKRIIKPIRHLYEGTEAVAKGDYSVQVPVTTADEIGTLTERFNEMASGLEGAHRKLKDKIALVNRDLEDQRMKLETILQSMTDCVFTVDRDFRITLFNRACEKFAGINADDATGMSCHNLFPSTECETRCLIRDLSDNHPAGTCWQTHITDVTGRRVPIMTCGAPLYDADGNFTGYVEVLRDVTELTKATDELRSTNTELEIANEELKKLDQLKTDFLNIASHELRTPLTSIKGFAGFVADEKLGELNEKQKDALSKVVSNSDRMIRLINNMLNMSKIRSGKLELNIARLDLSGLIGGVVADMKLVTEEKNISYTAEIPDGLVIDGDRDRIEQVLVNLLSNAIKFTPVDGSVSATAVDHETCVMVRVSDTGIGIAPGDLAHIFEEFWQVDKSKGTGLGLAITANIVREHGGAIWATSEVGRGSTFGFRLLKKVPQPQGSGEA